MRTPDHSTIAEFRRRHETEIAEIDGTKIKANASMDQNRSYRGRS